MPATSSTESPTNASNRADELGLVLDGESHALSGEPSPWTAVGGSPVLKSRSAANLTAQNAHCVAIKNARDRVTKRSPNGDPCAQDVPKSGSAAVAIRHETHNPTTLVLTAMM